MVESLFLAVPRGCLRFVIVVFPDHTHYFWSKCHHDIQPDNDNKGSYCTVKFLYNVMFGVHRNWPCYKGTALCIEPQV